MAHVHSINRPGLQVGQRDYIVFGDMKVDPWSGVKIDESRNIFLPAADVEQDLAVAVLRKRRLDESSCKPGQLTFDFLSEFSHFLLHPDYHQFAEETAQRITFSHRIAPISPLKRS